MKKHKILAKKIQKRLIELKKDSRDRIIFDSTNIWQNKNGKFERDEKNYEELQKILDDKDFPKRLLDQGFIDYIGCDMNEPEVPQQIYAGKIRHKLLLRNTGVLITNLLSKIPTAYVTLKYNPLNAGSWSQGQLVFGFKHDIVEPLIEYVDKNVEWRYNPESNAYCDGSQYTENNLKIIENMLEYILTYFDISRLEIKAQNLLRC